MPAHPTSTPNEIARTNEQLREANLALRQEVKQRQEAEEQAKANEKLLHSIFKSAPMGIGVVVNRVFTWINDKFSQITGFSQDELLGKNARMLYLSDEEYEQVGREKYRQINKDGSGSVNSQFRTKDGTIIDVHISSCPLNPDDLNQGVTFTVMDITAQKQANRALAQNEQRLSLALKGANLGMWDWDIPSENLYFDKRYTAMLGYEPNALPQRLENWLKLLHPDDLSQAQQLLHEILANKKSSWSHEFRIRAKDGHYVWIWGRGTVVEQDEQGNPTRASGTHLDISANKEAEISLSASEERFRELFNHMSSGVAIYQAIDNGQDFLIKNFNQAALDSSQVSLTEVLDQRLTHCFPGVREMGLLEVLQRVYRQGQPEKFPACQYKDCRLDLWVENYVCKLPSGEVVAIYDDITPRKQVEQALIHSKEQWQKTFDSIPDIITLQDKDMNIVQANQAAHAFFEKEDGELLGQKCHKIFRDINEICQDCPILTSLQDCRTHSEDIEHQRLKKIFHVTSAPVIDGHRNIEYLVHIAKDITEQKRLEKELFQAYKMEAMGTLAGGIAHDFNNILSAIIGFAELIKLDSPPDSQTQHDIDEILTAGERATKLVNQILSFSRQSAITSQPLLPHLIIKEALKMLRASLPSSIVIEENIDKECGHIMADPTQLHQIMINLCTNALHAMADEKGTLRVELHRQEITANQLPSNQPLTPGPFIVLTVSDTGCGMTPDTMEHIFEPYYTTKEVGRGTGLGLAVLHGIVYDAGGFIMVESSPGIGSTFSIHFPAVAADTPPPANNHRATPLPRGHEHILTVDDEAAITALHKTSLENLGYTVTAINDSRKALEIINNNPQQIDLLLTDQTMPYLTGAELAKEALQLRPDLPIILATGYSATFSEQDARIHGIRRYIGKPITIDKLAVILRETLDS